ncbi:hypothetical protein, partial [Sphingomonas sp. LaA6.9]|uniref:hypothetical protein n=1 Tax=Sphingomonas sp. LaA6.9 TaxID=2919914 RepID=UPI001F500A37
ALEAPFRRMLERYGLDAADWDKIRATPLEEDLGATWLKPRSIEDPVLQRRVMEMILAETDMAVPVPGIRQQALINSRAKRGTWLGELLRTGFQFKSFPVTVMFLQGQRIMGQQGWNRAAYATGMIALTTAAGALAIDMKDVAKGRDPRPHADWEFWLEAAFQGGGAGIYGDFIRSSESRFGSGIDDTLKGPAWQTAATIESLTLDPLWALKEGKDPKIGKKAVRALRSETPGGSLWYLRLGFERLLADQLQEWADPDYRQSWRRMERDADKRGQEFYWAPGETAPDRAPDISNLFEGQDQ